MARNYREGYNLFACNGILFNHESPRRGETFVTRKITRTLARIKAGKEKFLYLGNLDAKRDWGFAPEYVEAMWRILQQDTPDDYVIGTGESHTVREFVVESFSYAGLNWEKYVKIDPKYYRPTEVKYLHSDASKARTKLGWKSRISFKDLVRIMIDYDLEAEGLASPGEGRKILARKTLAGRKNILGHRKADHQKRGFEMRYNDIKANKKPELVHLLKLFILGMAGIPRLISEFKDRVMWSCGEEKASWRLKKI